MLIDELTLAHDLGPRKLYGKLKAELDKVGKS